MELNHFKNIIGKANTTAVRVTSAIVSLIMLFFLIIRIFNPSFAMPDSYTNLIIGFLVFHLISNLGAGLIEFQKSNKVFPVCHYCKGILEIHQYKCKSCGKTQ